MTPWLARLAAVSTLALVAACGGSDDDDHLETITVIAENDPRFSILAEALEAADLDDDLAATGTLTVFAPTNEAFAALLTELDVTKDALLANKPLLEAVLTYHVLGAEVKKAAVPLGRAIEPQGGGFFKIDAVGEDLIVTDGRNRTAEIILTDIDARNGVIHAIDKVLLPADKTIVQTAIASNPEFSILVEAVQAAGLADELSAAGPLTVFAPTNEAFGLLLTELNVSKEALLANTALLTEVLTYHVVPARVLKADVPSTPVTTLQGETFTVAGNPLTITDRRGRTATIAATDVLNSNGVIHVIDRVILPAAD